MVKLSNSIQTIYVPPSGATILFRKSASQMKIFVKPHDVKRLQAQLMKIWQHKDTDKFPLLKLKFKDVSDGKLELNAREAVDQKERQLESLIQSSSSSSYFKKQRVDTEENEYEFDLDDSSIKKPLPIARRKEPSSIDRMRHEAHSVKTDHDTINCLKPRSFYATNPVTYKQAAVHKSHHVPAHKKPELVLTSLPNLSTDRYSHIMDHYKATPILAPTGTPQVRDAYERPKSPEMRSSMTPLHSKLQTPVNNSYSTLSS